MFINVDPYPKTKRKIMKIKNCWFASRCKTKQILHHLKLIIGKEIHTHINIFLLRLLTKRMLKINSKYMESDGRQTFLGLSVPVIIDRMFDMSDPLLRTAVSPLYVYNSTLYRGRRWLCIRSLFERGHMCWCLVRILVQLSQWVHWDSMSTS